MGGGRREGEGGEKKNNNLRLIVEWERKGNQTRCCTKYAEQPHQQIPAQCLQVLPAICFY